MNEPALRLVPMRVRAHLAAGIAQAAPWGIALDGLLASELWARTKTTHRAAGHPYTRALDSSTAPPDLELPLARCRPTTGPWHWAATCAHPDQHPSRLDVRTWTGRVDARALEQMTTALPLTVSNRQGRYRARRMPLLVTPCSSVTWHAVGDVDQVRDLLADLVSIGKKRSTGEGHVLAWDIQPAPDLNALAAGHLHPDGTLGRPVPQACRHQLGKVHGTVVDGGLGRAGIRPPYMHPARQVDLVLPALLSSGPEQAEQQ
jgi:CRISPR type IV-associated protein Csf3